MKILQVISHYMPSVSFGGPLRVAHGLGKALVEQGHDVTVCCTDLLDLRVRLGESTVNPVILDGVRVFYCETRGLREWGFSPQLALRTLKEARDADIIFTHFHYQFASLVGGWCARLRSKPHLVWAHGSLNRHGIEASNPWLKRNYLRFLESGNFKNAMFTVFNSETERDQSISFGRETRIIPNGVDLSDTDSRVEKGEFRSQNLRLADDFIFVYLGRIAEGKGLDLLIPAFNKVLISGYKAHLVIIGGDERGFLERLKKQVIALSLCDYILFTGQLDGPQKWSALADANSFILPSRSEGVSITTLEAMLMSLPVIVTDRVGLVEVITQNDSGIVSAYDIGALSSAMIEMIQRTDRVEMGVRGNQLIRDRFNWRIITEDLLHDIGIYSP